MKVFFITSAKKLTGVKTWMQVFGLELVKSGHEVRYFTRDQDWAKSLKQAQLKVHTVYFGADFNPFSIVNFLVRFIFNRPDVIVVNVQKELLNAGIAARALNIPVIHRVGFFFSGSTTGKRARACMPWARQFSQV